MRTLRGIVGVFAVSLLPAIVVSSSSLTLSSQPPPPEGSAAGPGVEGAVPPYPGAQLEFELFLTEEDFLGGLEQLLAALEEISRRLPPLPEILTPGRLGGADPTQAGLAFLLSLYYGLTQAAGAVSSELLRRLVAATESFHARLYTLPAPPEEAAAFYDRHFEQAGWRRNLWVRTEELPGTARLYSASRAGRLRETAFLALFPWIDPQASGPSTGLLVLYARFR